MVEELPAAALLVAGRVAFDGAVRLPPAVSRRAAHLGRARSVEVAGRELDADPTAGAGREAQRPGALGDGERDPVAIGAGVELDLPVGLRAGAQPGHQPGDLL